MFVVLLTLLSAVPAAASGRIVGQATVIDGDTIEIHGQRIRLFAIDALESRQLCFDERQRPWRCGAVAANALADFIARRPVACRPVDRDRYGRTVATCKVARVDLAGWLVGQGLALDWPRYGRGRYKAAQGRAKAALQGVWKGRFEVPWEWRRSHAGRPENRATRGVTFEVARR